MDAGARRQERAEAQAAVVEAQAVHENAIANLERGRALLAERVISEQDLQSYVRTEAVARAQLEGARQRHALVVAPPRKVERDVLVAQLEQAKAQLEQARAVLGKTEVRSPLDGTVLRKHHRVGESITNSSMVSDPIFTLGDQSQLSVRVEVDERDIAQLEVGQQAYVTSEAYPGRKFRGHVLRIGQELGRKHIVTDEPTEKVDTKVLEVVIRLDEANLPIGLRVDAFILTTSASPASPQPGRS